jgi:hypothetical protein
LGSILRLNLDIVYFRITPPFTVVV